MTTPRISGRLPLPTNLESLLPAKLPDDWEDIEKAIASSRNILERIQSECLERTNLWNAEVTGAESEVVCTIFRPDETQARLIARRQGNGQYSLEEPGRSGGSHTPAKIYKRFIETFHSTLTGDIRSHANNKPESWRRSLTFNDVWNYALSATPAIPDTEPQ